MFDLLAIPPPLPAHSPRGGSSAERFMECTGSVSLIQEFKRSSSYTEDDPDYRSEGTQAHALGAHCLEDGIDAWEADPKKFPDLTANMRDGVQVHLDYARSLPGRMEVEVKFHLPEFHHQFYGTADLVVFDWEVLEVVDYKHGVGVVVEPEENPQLMYYAWGKIASGDFRDDMPVRLTIVQPRKPHRNGPIRTWNTTVGYIRDWAENELKPAMEVTADVEYLSMGEWCRFCPAKLVCPAFDGLAKKALRGINLVYAERQQLRMLLKAGDDADQRRLMSGERPEDVGAKIVKKRGFRQFKGAAPIVEKFGDDAWDKSLKSPAQIEKLPGGKAFVAEWAFMPETEGYKLVGLNDPGPAASPKTLEEKYGDPAKQTID